MAQTIITEDTIVVAARPLHRPIHPFPASWLLFTLVGCTITDFVYWRTAEMMWANFSAWFISVGCVLAVLTLIAAIFDVATDRLVAPGSTGWLTVIGYFIVLVLAVIDAMVHTHDAWTSVVPWGATLSVLTLLIALIVCCWTWLAARREEVL